MVKCSGCSLILKEPYICCAQCKPLMCVCLRCFAKGREFYNHSNNHGYEVKSTSFSLFGEQHWSAREEMKLLESIEEHGFGNWKMIAKKVGSKSFEECERHYMKCYVDTSTTHQALPKFTVNKELCWRRPIKMKAGDNTIPRPDGSSPDDPLYSSGYMPARGDFLIEYDNFAECDIKEVDFDSNEEDDLIQELNLAVVEIYYRRLKDRKLRRQILKKYGLLDAASSNRPVKVYEYGRDERNVRDAFVKFAQILPPEEHEKLIQSILYERHLKFRIASLQEYRCSGLKTFRDARLYEKLKTKRRTNKPKCFKLDDILQHSDNAVSCRAWLQRQMNGKNSQAPMPPLPPLSRKPANPLDLHDAPGIELLTEDEIQLCSTLRFLPEVYMSHRDRLQKISFHDNGVTLQYARSVLKVDVNKTKRLYDFLVEKGIIKAADSEL